MSDTGPLRAAASAGSITRIGSSVIAKTVSGQRRRHTSATQPRNASAIPVPVIQGSIGSGRDERATTAGTERRSATTAIRMSVPSGCRAQNCRNTPGGFGRRSSSSAGRDSRPRTMSGRSSTARLYASRVFSTAMPPAMAATVHTASVMSAGTGSRASPVMGDPMNRDWPAFEGR